MAIFKSINFDNATDFNMLLGLGENVNFHSGYGDSPSMLLANHGRYEFVLDRKSSSDKTGLRLKQNLSISAIN
jgi:hypothetical protein